jgi:hypothetical protein
VLSGKKAESEVVINQQAVEADRRLDCKFVLTTNTSLSPTEVAKTYKGLRPDDTWPGHIVASFLGLRLEVDLQVRLADESVETLRPDLMRDLKQLRAIMMTLDGTPYLNRTDFQGVAYQALKVAGARPLSRVMRLDGAAHPVVP